MLKIRAIAALGLDKGGLPDKFAETVFCCCVRRPTVKPTAQKKNISVVKPE